MDGAQVDAIYKHVCDLVLNTGEYVRTATHAGRSTTEAKANYADLVTEYDQVTEKKLISDLSATYPDHKFIGEETTCTSKKLELTDSPTWIIDPIDGTTNFVHSFPFYCISIALYVNKEPLIALVYDVAKDSLFSAIKGRGAYCNGRLLKPSPECDLSNALLISEFGSQRDEEFLKFKIDQMSILIRRCHGIRSLGSAALGGCYVAAGYAEAVYEYGIHAWDMAASRLIATEAGAIVTSPTGQPADLMSRQWLVCNSAKLASEIQSMLSKYPLERE